ncbi:MAG: ParB/RepB/Spo0J family partition protein [Clostridia bacterium]|nr:ParB/RepB/Spo0J family partition protein [Clostridia bacterium]
MNILQTVLPKLNKNDSLDRVHKIPVCRILPNPAQPRKYFDSNETLRLADSIRIHGILQPLCVRKPVSEEDIESFNGIYELISGERRLRAAKLLGLSEVPCIIIEADSLKSAELAIIENLQREDLNIFEEASAIAALINLYGLTQEEVAAKLSSSQSYVANKLRLLRFDEFEQKMIIEKHLTERHARALLRISDLKMRKATLETIIERGYNVADTEGFVSKLVDETSADKEPKKIRSALVKDIRIFYNTLDRAVDIMNRAGINAKTHKKDLGDMFEITVRIPKCKEE